MILTLYFLMLMTAPCGPSNGILHLLKKKFIFTDTLHLLILRLIILNLLQMVNFPYQENVSEFTVHNFDYHQKKKANMQHLSFLHK